MVVDMRHYLSSLTNKKRQHLVERLELGRGKLRTCSPGSTWSVQWPIAKRLDILFVLPSTNKSHIMCHGCRSKHDGASEDQGNVTLIVGACKTRLPP